MRLDHHVSPHPRLLRKTALGNAPVPTPGPRTKAAKTPKRTTEPAGTDKPKLTKTSKTASRHSGSRFLGATHLDAERKARIDAALKSHGIGDEIGRQILIGALEYQLSALGGQLQRHGEAHPQPSPRRNDAADLALQAIGEQTRLLADRLRTLPETSRDVLTRTLAHDGGLGHSYDDRYLGELACEIERLEHACARAAARPATQPEVPTQAPASSRALIAKLAYIFSECFEKEPTADAGGHFQTLLTVLDDETGFVIAHDPALLKDILSGYA